MQFMSNIYSHLEKKHYLAEVFLDVSKAFDSLSHKILLCKLSNFGIRGIHLRFLHSYLTHRHPAVYCNNKYSSFKPICKGVPQGSILGPILFIIYINDIVHASSKLKYTIYADDTNLLMGDTDLDNLHINLNNEFDVVNKWIKNNNLSLNVFITNYIIFRNRSVKHSIPPAILEGTILEKVTYTKF